MGKRSDFERVPRDFYPTPYEAVVPLLPHLVGVRTFHEPCAGDGRLIDHLETNNLRCVGASDISPRRDGIKSRNAFDIRDCLGEVFITNPPWDRKILHPLIYRLSDIAPTWLLFDADWCHTRQSIGPMCRCKKIVSVGRVKWIPGSKMTGKDNCAWYLFDKRRVGQTAFYGRTVRV